MLIVILGSYLISTLVKPEVEKNEKITIVTSFYPMYVLAENIVGDNPNIEVVNLTNFQSGCLHDYQLTTADMKKLEKADILIMNGGGMESFVENVVEAYPKLPIINASEGIDYLLSESHSNVGDQGSIQETTLDGDNHDSIEYNAHVWLNMNYYIQQIQTVQDALVEYDPQNSDIYQHNGNAYQEEVKTLKEEMESTLRGIENTKVVIFHDSFAYLAQEFGLKVVHTVDMDSESSLSAGEIAEVIDEVNKNQIKILFTEEQFSTSIANNIARETGATVYVIDSIVRGKMSKDGYITAMKKNLEVLKQALGTQ